MWVWVCTPTSVHAWHEIAYLLSQGERSRLTLDESTGYELLQESHADHATETSAYYNNPSCVTGLEEVRTPLPRGRGLCHLHASFW